MKGFLKKLDTLVEEVRQAKVHFVKCLKINDTEQDGSFDNKIVSDQLTSSGILDVCNFQAETGFSYTAPFASFVKHYVSKAPSAVQDVLKKKLTDQSDEIKLIEAYMETVWEHAINKQDFQKVRGEPGAPSASVTSQSSARSRPSRL